MLIKRHFLFQLLPTSTQRNLPPSAFSEHQFLALLQIHLDFFGPCSSKNMGESAKEPGSRRRSSFKDTVRQAGQAVSNLEQKIEQKLTVLWNEVEEWQRDNHYIHSGYRPQSNSYLGSLGRYILPFPQDMNLALSKIGAHFRNL